MGLLSKIFGRKEEATQQEEDKWKARIDYLKGFLGDTKEIVIASEGDSEEVIKFCSENNLDYNLTTKVTKGSRDQLAREELETMYGAWRTPKKARYWAGRTLGYRPIEIAEQCKKVAAAIIHERDRGKVIKFGIDLIGKGVPRKTSWQLEL